MALPKFGPFCQFTPSTGEVVNGLKGWQGPAVPPAPAWEQVPPLSAVSTLVSKKVLAVGKNNPRYTNVWNYTDIYPHMLKEITHFFSIYKDLEGKRVEIKGWHDAAYARDRVLRATKLFEEGKAKPVALRQKVAK